MISQIFHLITISLMVAFTCAEPSTGNELFMDCCVRQSRIPSGCYDYCNYASFAKNGLTNMYLNTDYQCPRTALGSYLYCAGSGADHRAKCERAGVSKTLAGDKCSDLCDMRPGTVLELGWSHLPCWSVLDRVRTIFETYADIKSKPQEGIDAFFTG